MCWVGKSLSHDQRGIHCIEQYNKNTWSRVTVRICQLELCGSGYGPVVGYTVQTGYGPMVGYTVQKQSQEIL
jgi:hypothetical protein